MPTQSDADKLDLLLREAAELGKQRQKLHEVAEKLRDTSADNRAARFAFLNSELDAGKTFAEVALSSTHADKRARNRARAEQALASFLKYRKYVRLTVDESKRLSPKLRGLKRQLKELQNE